MWTTPSDLARYALEVQRALAGTPTWSLQRPTIQWMLTPGLNDWAWARNPAAILAIVTSRMAGANEGYRCQLVADNEGDGVVVMTNGDGGGQLAMEIVRSVAREYGWPDFQPEAPSALTKTCPSAFE